MFLYKHKKPGAKFVFIIKKVCQFIFPNHTALAEMFINIYEMSTQSTKRQFIH